MDKGGEIDKLISKRAKLPAAFRGFLYSFLTTNKLIKDISKIGKRDLKDLAKNFAYEKVTREMNIILTKETLDSASIPC